MDNKEYTLKGTIEKGISKEGREYEYLSLKLSETYSKRVFLQGAEKDLLLSNNKPVNPFGK